MDTEAQPMRRLETANDNISAFEDERLYDHEVLLELMGFVEELIRDAMEKSCRSESRT